MAWPDDHSKITTNLTPLELEDFIKAVESGEAKHVKGSTSLFAESGSCDFMWLGQRVHMEEWVEEVTHIYALTADHRTQQPQQQKFASAVQTGF